MLNSILTETVSSGITLPQLVICTLTSLGLGLALAFLHTYRNTSSRNFVMTLAILPAVVQAVIMLVNGNLGTGVAVMGAFGLVRFRSAPGNAREIGSVFLAMAIGLANSNGQDDRTSKQATYRIVRKLVSDFREQNGSTLCPELKGIKTKQPLRSCDGCIVDALQLAADALAGLPADKPLDA